MQDFLQAARAAFALVGSLDPEFVGIVRLSLSISLSAAIVAMLIGAPFGGVLAVARFHGRRTIIVLANALLGLPPVVVGLTIYLLLSRSGPLGFAGLLFTPAAMIIAQVVLTTPIVIALVHRPAAALWSEYADLMRIDGLSKAHSILELFVIGRSFLLTASPRTSSQRWPNRALCL